MSADETVRYCPECGLIGPIKPPAHACCPDSFGMSLRRWQAEKMERVLDAARGQRRARDAAQPYYLSSDGIPAEGRAPDAANAGEAAEELLSTEQFLRGVRDDGTVEGYSIETYYQPCKGIGDDAGFLRVQVDDNATDIETRVPHSALLTLGWRKVAGVAADESTRAPDGWIAVDERMPEPGTECLVYGPHWFWERPYVRIDTWDEQREAPVGFSSATVPVGLGWGDSAFEEVTHWMPLPAPPSGERTSAPAPEGSGEVDGSDTRTGGE